MDSERDSYSSAHRHLKPQRGGRCVETLKPRVPKPQRGDRYVEDNIKNMKELPTNDQKWLRYRLFKQALSDRDGDPSVIEILR